MQQAHHKTVRHILVPLCATQLKSLNCRRCLEVRDPYCGWEERTQYCVGAISGFNPNWVQSLDGCPTNDVTMDGQFGDWSSWSSCPQHETSGDSCLCRLRACDSPKPKLGGKQCIGPTVQVSNCTRTVFHCASRSMVLFIICCRTRCMDHLGRLVGVFPNLRQCYTNS